MAKEKVAKFFEQLAADKALAEKLAAADKAYAEQHQGEQADEAAEKAAVGAIVLPLAKEAGFDFTAEELFAYVQEELAGEVSDDEMANAAGGRRVVSSDRYIRRDKTRWQVFKEYVQDEIDSFERYKREKEVEKLQGAPRFDYLKDVK